MGRTEYLKMATDQTVGEVSMDADLREFANAAKRLANHAILLSGGLGFGTSFLKWLACIAAIYLLILDRTNWKTNMLTSLLGGEVGKWIAFIAIVLRLFFPRHFPDWLEMPGSLILLLVAAPSLFAHTVRDSWVGVLICLIIGCYLLQEHIRASGGFRNSFTKTHGFSNTIGIVLILVYPVWGLIMKFI